MKKVTLKVEDLSYPDCETEIKQAIMRIPSMKRVSINLLSKTVVAEWDQENVTEQDVIRIIKEQGYHVL